MDSMNKALMDARKRQQNPNRATKDIDDPIFRDIMNRDKLLIEAVAILEDDFHGEAWRARVAKFIRAAKRLTKVNT